MVFFRFGILHMLAILTPALIAIAAYIQPFIKPRLLFLDPLVAATETDSCCQTYLGIVSVLGVNLWFITAAACLFGAFILFRQHAPRPFLEFSLFGGLLSLWLALDDQLLIHENLAPKLGVPQNLVLLLIAVSAVIYCVRCRQIIVRSDPVMFGLATGFLGASVVIDVLHISTDDWPFLVDSGPIFIEDGLKLIGIFCWSVFHVMGVARLCDPKSASSQVSDLSLPNRGHAEGQVDTVSGSKSFSEQSVLLLGNIRPTLFIARQLKLQGAHVIAGLEGGELGAEHSRYVDEIWDHPRVADDAGAFIDALEAFTKHRSISTVIPISEEFVRAFSERSPNLPSTTALAMNDPDLVRVCLDKTGLMELCRSIGIPVAPYAVVDKAASLRETAEELGYPLVVRPFVSTARINNEKAVRLRAPSDLAELQDSWSDDWGGLIVQKQVSGLRNNIYFAAHKGAVRSLLQSKIFRTDRLDGSGLAVDGWTVEPDDRLVGHIEALAKKLNYSGIGCAQFLVDDARDEIWFLENNPRISGSHAIPEYCGLNLTGFQVALAQGRLASHSGATLGTTGVHYGWMPGDLSGLKYALRARHIGLIGAVRWLVKSLFTRLTTDLDMVLRWDDPMPGAVGIIEAMPFGGRFVGKITSVNTGDAATAPGEHKVSELAKP